MIDGKERDGEPGAEDEGAGMRPGEAPAEDERRPQLEAREGWHPRKVGFVGLAGAPNVGKSTLVNRLVGQKVTIVSERPQTTRERVCGIYTDERMQVVLVDIPGILESPGRFNQILMEWAEYGLRGSDRVLHLRDASRPGDEGEAAVADLIRRSGRPVWLVWNKIDAARNEGWKKARLAGDYERTFGVSALTGEGVDELLNALAESLPHGPLLYDPEQVSDRDIRFLAGELVREQLFRHLGQELPYLLATEVDVFDEEREKPLIRIVILTEKESHKPMIIGKGGAMLKQIGQAARAEIEELLERPVFLELWVKVRQNWRKDEFQLSRLGLKPPKMKKPRVRKKK